MADGKYTDLEKKIIKTLQNVFAPSFQFDLISPIYCLTPVWFVYNHFAGGYKTFVKKEEVNITIQDDILKILATKSTKEEEKDEDGKYLRREI